MSFHWEIYLLLNPDLEHAGIKTEKQCIQHWIHHGISEQRKCNIYDAYPDFNWKNYTSAYPDLKHMSKREAELHWIKYGRNEERTYIPPSSSSDSTVDTKTYIRVTLAVDDDSDIIRVALTEPPPDYSQSTPVEQPYKPPVGPVTTCIITAYYVIPSKFGDDKYRMWIYNFMNTVKVPVFLFTSSNLVSYFQSFKKPNVYIIPRPFESMFFYKYMDIFRYQWFMDNIKYKRSPQLYCIWHNKLRFIEEVANITNYSYDNYIWCDIGAFREKDLLPVRQRFGMLRRRLDLLTLLALRKPETKDSECHDDGIFGDMHFNEVFIGGGVLGVPVNKIQYYIQLQMDVFHKLCKSRRFFGCDQKTLAYMVNEYPNSFKMVYAPAHYSKHIHPENADRWFYMLDYFCS
jgi:hypothetical protein